MNEKIFRILAVTEVKHYHNEHNPDNIIGVEDVYVVWMCKTLQNNKALLSTTVNDGMYYEVTLNGDKKELYLDAYKKVENRCKELKGM